MRLKFTSNQIEGWKGFCLILFASSCYGSNVGLTRAYCNVGSTARKELAQTERQSDPKRQETSYFLNLSTWVLLLNVDFYNFYLLFLRFLCRKKYVQSFL